MGGGSAGWITAGLIASTHCVGESSEVEVVLVESPDVKTIGVGEGTWPTMRSTLKKIGISELEFVQTCQASLKQGTRFHGWVNGGAKDIYYHPFSVPAGYPTASVVPFWQEQKTQTTFANAVSEQGYVCDHGLSPKMATMPDYAQVLNYGYHLDAGKFAQMLQTHCTTVLGVRHVLDHVTGIEGHAGEDIQALVLDKSGLLEGDLFIDCTGQAARLIGEHYGIGLESQDHILFNNRAWAAQVPYAKPTDHIQSQTNSTAQSGGWVWDIGLASRRGIGYVYSSAHSDDDQALSTLWEYLSAQPEADLSDVTPRQLKFDPGYRKVFWHRNCVAVGMAGGFIEPLEASALVMIELAATRITEELPATRTQMALVAKRFNDDFTYRWERIIEFLKLHYVLSQRQDSAYWQDHRASDSVPARLTELLALWQYQVPSTRDFPRIDEIFSAASYQYVLYGMGFETTVRQHAQTSTERERAYRLFTEVAKKSRQLARELPDNRAFQHQIAGLTPQSPTALHM